MPHVNVEGPAGQLEVRVDGDSGSNIGAVLCHPHPLYGGSMDDMVLEAMSRPLLDVGFQVARFNFRGVGHSEGQHDDGKGEVDDVLAVVAWMREQGVEKVILGGYSFGAVVALSACDLANPEKLWLVAPPVSMLGENLNQPAVPCTVVLGDSDQFVDATEVESWFNNASVSILPHTDHFFFGQHDRISTLFGETL